jgi:hypothetical protein
VIVAVIAVLVMQVTVDEVVRVVAVRHRFVTARRPVLVIRRVLGRVPGCASRGILRVDRECVVVDVVAVHVMEVAVVQVVRVAFVLDGGVAAVRSVNVLMVTVWLVRVGHLSVPPLRRV